MPIKYSDNFKNIKKRIKKLPIYQEKGIKAKLKIDANGIIKEYQDGLYRNTLELKELQPATIKAKQKKGYAKPNNPLYGKGKTEEYSLYNALQIFETKKGYSIRPKAGKEHDSNITIKQLFDVHEYGRLIKRGNYLIRIPARPALKNAYGKYLMKKSKKEFSKDMKKAIVLYINKGQDKWFKLFKEK